MTIKRIFTDIARLIDSAQHESLENSIRAMRRELDDLRIRRYELERDVKIAKFTESALTKDLAALNKKLKGS